MRPPASAARLAIVSVLCFSPPALAGQAVASATVTGVVRDRTDAVVAGAAVEMRNHATNQQWQTQSDARGRFRVLYLPVGEYQLSVQLAGFATAHANLTLVVGDQFDVPIVLDAAGVNEAVDVSAP